MTTVLAGTPNCGKTTLFNRLTGLHLATGNRAGVTVDVSVGRALVGKTELQLADLPGMYSLEHNPAEGAVAADYIKREGQRVICVIDLTAPQRGIALAMQLARLGRPTVIGANFVDRFRSEGGKADIPGLEKALGLPVVPFSAYTGENAERLVLTEGRVNTDFPSEADLRFGLAEELCKKYISPAARDMSAENIFSRKLLPYAAFTAIMAAVFFISFGPPGRALSKLAEGILLRFTALLSGSVSLPRPLETFLFSGVIPGATSLLAFLPQLFMLFLLIAALEDSGLMSRAAFVFDAPMRKLGLEGQAVVPLILGLGCTVPAVFAARTVSDSRRRRRLTLALPFISCGAKLPVYAFFASEYFGKYAPAVIALLYLLGFASALLSAGLSSRKQPESAVTIELPRLQRPRAGVLLKQAASGSGHYLKRAVGPMSLAFGIFALLSQTPLLERMCSFISPAFVPLGFGHWQYVAALTAGFLGKEAVLGALSVLAAPDLGTAGAFSLLVFVLLYTPCISAVSAISNQLGKKEAAGLALRQLAAAYFASFVLFSVLKYL